MKVANWENFTVREIVERISNEDVVLPVIQRRLVWESDKMEALFDSLFQQNSFGSIICTEEGKGSTLLFPYRLFTPDGSNLNSDNVKTASKPLLFVIDGQQRLQSFYIGLCGTYEGKTMYYDLFSDYKDQEHDFKFAAPGDVISKANLERYQRIDNGASNILRETCWFPVPALFTMLKRTTNERKIAERIFNTFVERGTIRQKDKLYELKEKHIQENVRDFKDRIFGDRSIGISKVEAHMCENINDDRQRIVEMFQRLNSNGTRLSTYDLVASTLKGFNYKMESFLDNATEENKSIGVDQDVLIKMLLVLNDDPNRGMADMTPNNAAFITDNIERIQATLDALRVFLKASKHEEWFGTITRSSIPLYVLAYHIFYKSDKPAEIKKLFVDLDPSNVDFHNMSLWLKLSLLNNVFKKGCGWDPAKTGIKNIHQILSGFHGKIFPVDRLIKLYIKHLHHFFDDRDITPECLDSLDQDYIFYLIYGGNTSSTQVMNKDHIHPRTLLGNAKVSPLKISSIGNLQLLDSKTNIAKSGKELRDWIKDCHAEDKRLYISKHLIPEDESLWTSDRFEDFLSARLKLIANKIKSEL